MVILRRTQKLSSSLGESPIVPAESDTALGDWYVNRIVVHRQPLLLLISSKSLLPMLLPARDVQGLPSRLASVVEARLKRSGIADQAIAAEVRTMDRVAVGPTADRSVLGIMVDFAKGIPHYLEQVNLGDAALHWTETLLSETPCHAGRPFDKVIFPNSKTPELLHARWIMPEIRPVTEGAIHFHTFLEAIARAPDRDGVLGDEELTFPPVSDTGSYATPRNALTFGRMGVDGVHYAILTINGVVTDQSPVIHISPMDFSEPYAVLGESFLDYLAAACGVSVVEMQSVFEKEWADRNALLRFLRERFKHSRLFEESRLRRLDRLLMYIQPKS